MRLLAAFLAAASACAVLGCTTYEEDLNRSQRAFDENEHERALAILRQLEYDEGRLSTSDRAHYCYLRGMTDYRIGYKTEARHWLALASAIEVATPGSLPPDSLKRMNDALKEMNEAVYSGGIAALTNDVTQGKSQDDDEESARDSKESETTPDKAESADPPAKPKKKKPAKTDDESP